MLASEKVQKTLFGVFIALLAAIAAVLVINRVTVGAPSQRAADVTNALDGNTMPAHARAANFTLTNQYGRRVSLNEDRGKVVVLTFIYSHCKNDCPFMVEQIKGALNMLGRDAGSIRVIGVSVQPRQDTRRSRLHFLAEHEMTGRMQYLDGPVKVLRRVWKKYGIAPETRKSPHSAFVLVINQQGIEKVGFPAIQLTSGGLAHDIRLLQRRPSA